MPERSPRATGWAWPATRSSSCAATWRVCAVALLDTLVGDHHELVMVIEGATATAEATERVREWLGSDRPKVAVDVQCWRQPLSAYLFSIE